MTWVRNYSSSANTTFSITNTGNSTISGISFSATQLKYGSNALTGSLSFEPSTLSLDALETKEVDVTLSGVSATQTVGTYTGKITTHYGGSEHNSTISVKVESIDHSIDVPSTIKFYDASRGKNYSKVFSVENDGNTVLHNIVISTNISSGFQPKLNVSTFTLQPGEEKDVKLNITVPSSEAYGDKAIGYISIESDEKDFGNAILVSADVVSKLKIADIDATIGTNSKKSADEGETVDAEAVPGDRVVLDIRVENHFDDDEDMEIQDITVTGTIEGVDDGDDLEEETDEFDLDPERNERVYLTFDLPNDAENGEYDVVVKAVGEDEDGKTHSDEWKFSIEVKRSTHEVKFTKAELLKSNVKCGEDAQLVVEIINIGRKDEDNVRVTVTSPELKIEEAVSNIELDSDPDDDNTYSNTFSLSIPKDAEEKTYKVTARAYYGGSILDDAETLTLTVSDCGQTSGLENKTVTPEPPKPKAPKQNATTTTKQNVTSVPANATMPTKVTTTVETSFFDTQEYIVVLALGTVVAILLIVIIIVNLMQPRKEVSTLEVVK